MQLSRDTALLFHGGVILKGRPPTCIRRLERQPANPRAFNQLRREGSVEWLA